MGYFAKSPLYQLHLRSEERSRRGFHTRIHTPIFSPSIRSVQGVNVTDDSSAKASKETPTTRESPRPAPVPGLAARLPSVGTCVVRVPGAGLALSSTRNRTTVQKPPPGGWKGESRWRVLRRPYPNGVRISAAEPASGPRASLCWRCWQRSRSQYLKLLNMHATLNRLFTPTSREINHHENDSITP